MRSCTAEGTGARGSSCPTCSVTPPQLGRCQRGPLAWRTLLISHTMQSGITFSLSPGFSQQGITEASGRTGNLTIALHDTHQVFKTMESFHNFSKAAGEEKKKKSQAMFLKDQFLLAGILML